MKLGKVGAFAARRRARARRLQPGRRARGGKGTINIGIELPQQGSELAASQPIINGIKLASRTPAARPAAGRSRSRTRSSSTTPRTASTIRRPAPRT